MSTAEEDFKIAMNILARVGINSPDFVKEYAKAKLTINKMEGFQAAQSVVDTPVTPPQVTGAPIPPQGTLEPLGGNNGLNQPQMNEGQGTLNLP